MEKLPLLLQKSIREYNKTAIIVLLFQGAQSSECALNVERGT